MFDKLKLQQWHIFRFHHILNLQYFHTLDFNETMLLKCLAAALRLFDTWRK